MEFDSSPVVIGCDHAAYPLKETVKAFLEKNGIAVEDVGTHSEESVDYTDVAIKVASMVSEKKVDRGILLCGTGLGMSMAANRFKHVRAALCTDLFSAMMSRRHNNANILVLGGRITGVDLALEIVRVWLSTPFEGGRHARRVDKFSSLGR